MMLKDQAASRRSRKNTEEEFFDACEIEEEGFIEGEVNVGKVLSTFSFGISSAAEAKEESRSVPTVLPNGNEPVILSKHSEHSVQPKGSETPVQVNCNETSIQAKGHGSSLYTQGNTIFSSHTDPYASASAPRGLTPPINGESFTVKRAYAMRPSTVRKLNALKAQHPDVNMLFNTLVDMAITHYYNHITNENGSFQCLKENKATS